jgi:hydrogenase maturation protein HypF
MEYDDPRDRRFHAQPNACPVCGPQLELWNAAGEAIFGGHDTILAAAQAICRGQIVAVKGIGGFHLVAAAHDEQVVQRLRERKHREEKPFALLFPTLASVESACEVSALEARLLRSPEAPIVLLRKLRTPHSELSTPIAPGNPNLGVMLPSNPLHHLLMAELGFPIVATSGNLTDEPICTDEHEALDRLRGIADLFLAHNRPIVRHMDDSIVRVMVGREMILRRARGYAPLPVQIKKSKLSIQNVLAVGAHLKNSVALALGEQVFISQHIGDLETEQANAAFRRVIGDLEKLYDATPKIIAADLHPDYLSAKFAQEVGRAEMPLGQDSQQRVPTIVGVQHHVAHVLSCMTENELAPPVLGVAWDGTGYGADGTIWGGEFFLVTQTGVERVAHLRPFRLPGGDRAVKEPRRAALGLLYEMFGDAVFLQKDLSTVAAFSEAEIGVLRTMLKRGLNAPFTSSIGRLFDAVASLIGMRQEMRFEGQAAMELEFALEGVETDETYKLFSEHRRDGTNQSPIVIDWLPMVEAILADRRHGLGVGVIAAKFHNALVQTITDVANRIGQPKVVLSGGCFQNRCLTERTVTRLQAKGFHPYWHQRVPTNDGGIALGQVYAARHQLELRK